jgi:hypothetical protein
MAARGRRNESVIPKASASSASENSDVAGSAEIRPNPVTRARSTFRSDIRYAIRAAPVSTQTAMAAGEEHRGRPTRRRAPDGRRLRGWLGSTRNRRNPGITVTVTAV